MFSEHGTWGGIGGNVGASFFKMLPPKFRITKPFVGGGGERGVVLPLLLYIIIYPPIITPFFTPYLSIIFSRE